MTCITSRRLGEPSIDFTSRILLETKQKDRNENSATQCGVATPLLGDPIFGRKLRGWPEMLVDI